MSDDVDASRIADAGPASRHCEQAGSDDSFMRRARTLRRTATGPEAKLWAALRGERLNGWKFRRQHPIDRFVVDFACLRAKLVIEVDGATHGSPVAIDRDAERTRILETAGFHVVRIDNADVTENLAGVLESILSILMHRQHL